MLWSEADSFTEKSVQELVQADVPVSVVFFDKDFVLSQWNETFCRILAQYDRPVPQLSARIPYYEYLPQEACELVRAMRQARDDRRPVRLPNLCLRDLRAGKAVESYWTSYLAPVLNRTGAVVGVLAFIEDVTEILRQKREIAVLRKELEERDAALRVLMRLREEDRTQVVQDYGTRIQQELAPCIVELESVCTGQKQQSAVAALKRRLGYFEKPERRLAEYGLTPREIELAQLVREGLSSKAIADRLCISRESVNSHRQHIRRKLGLSGQKQTLKAFLQHRRTSL